MQESDYNDEPRSETSEFSDSEENETLPMRPKRKKEEEQEKIEKLIKMLEKANSCAQVTKKSMDTLKDDINQMKQEIEDLTEENRYWRETLYLECNKAISMELKLSQVENDYQMLRNENKYLSLRKSTRKPNSQPIGKDAILKVSNLSPRVTHEDLSQMCGHIGQLKRINLSHDYAEPHPSANAEIVFCNKEDGKRAIEVYQGFCDGMGLKCTLED